MTWARPRHGSAGHRQRRWGLRARAIAAALDGSPCRSWRSGTAAPKPLASGALYVFRHLSAAADLPSPVRRRGQCRRPGACRSVASGRILWLRKCGRACGRPIADLAAIRIGSRAVRGFCAAIGTRPVDRWASEGQPRLYVLAVFHIRRCAGSDAVLHAKPTVVLRAANWPAANCAVTVMAAPHVASTGWNPCTGARRGCPADAVAVIEERGGVDWCCSGRIQVRSARRVRERRAGRGFPACCGPPA